MTPSIDLLTHYGLTPADQIGSGTEAHVYRYGATSVLKIYPRTTATRLAVLQRFYAGLDGSNVPFALPRITQIDAHGDAAVTFETLLPGTPLATLLYDHVRTTHSHNTPLTSANALPLRVFDHYLATVRAVQRIAPPRTMDGRAIVRPAAPDWHGFLRNRLQQQARTLAQPLTRDVTGFSQKIAQLDHALARPYHGDYRLIHGDIFPGNLLVDDTLRVTALLDFGVFTMLGDPLWDLATGWVFFDMYNELGIDARTRLWALMQRQVDKTDRATIARYVLLYSLFSANLYDPACNDGHYQWCVANLNDPNLWEMHGTDRT